LKDEEVTPGAKAAELIPFLRDYANTRLNSRLADARRCLPPQVVLDFGRQGLFGLRVPRDLGGLELDWRAGGSVVEQLATIDLTLAMMVGIHNELGIGPTAMALNITGAAHCRCHAAFNTKTRESLGQVRLFRGFALIRRLLGNFSQEYCEIFNRMGQYALRILTIRLSFSVAQA
jgi:alkylation response protein AidB-like acyl-CoA dehydrogenase